MMLHGLWNLSTNLGLAFFATYLFFMVPAFIGVIIVVAVAADRYRASRAAERIT